MTREEPAQRVQSILFRNDYGAADYFHVYSARDFSLKVILSKRFFALK